MAELPFLGSYTGSSLDKLLSYEGRYRTDSLVVALEGRLLEKAVAGHDLTRVELDVLAVCTLEREVNNGGFHQLFANECAWVADVVGALGRIGCPLTAALTQEAIDLLGCGAAPSCDEIRTVIDDESREDELFDALEPLDLRFYEYLEDITVRLFDYVKRNATQVLLAMPS